MFFWRDIRALEDMGYVVDILSTRMPPAGRSPHPWSQDAIARTTYLAWPNPVNGAAALARLIPRGLPLWLTAGGPAFTSEALIMLPAAQALFRHARNQDLSHVHVPSSGRAALIAALARRMGGPPFSLALHGPLDRFGPGQRFKWQEAAFATALTPALAQEAHDRLGDAVPDRLLVRPIGIDPATLERSGPYKPPERGRPMRLLSCGRLVPEKGHQDVLGAMRQLLDQGVDVRLDIAGEDETRGRGFRKTLEADLRRLRLQDHVRLLGAIGSDDLRDRLEQAHLFVLAPWAEPSGGAYIEAMAMGVPVVGTDTGGVSGLIEDGRTGYLVPARNPGTLARTVRTLAQDPDALRRLSMAGRAHVTAYFDLRHGARVLADEIARAVAQSADADTA